MVVPSATVHHSRYMEGQPANDTGDVLGIPCMKLRRFSSSSEGHLVSSFLRKYFCPGKPIRNSARKVPTGGQ